MIGLDTNVLVRYLIADDPAQVARVDRLLDDSEARSQPLHLDVIVLCETVWVLRRAYRRSKPEIVALLQALLETRQFSIADRDAVREAVTRYAEGPADFADYLIGTRNEAAGCSTTVTFDRALDGDTNYSSL